MTNLRFYALQDLKTGIISMFSTALNDEFALQFYVQSINDIFKKLKGEKDRIQFLNSVHNSKLVRLADIDCAKPEIVQNFAFIADFNDLVLEKDKRIKCSIKIICTNTRTTRHRTKFRNNTFFY